MAPHKRRVHSRTDAMDSSKWFSPAHEGPRA
jgi:hypothetical protein